MNEDQAKHFIAGFLIADGSIGWLRQIKQKYKYPQIQIGQKEREILDIINEQLVFFNIIPNLKKLHYGKSNEVWQLRFSGKEAIKFLKWLPNLVLTRKEIIKQEIINSGEKCPNEIFIKVS